LGSTPSLAIAADVYAQQTGAGKVAGDFATLLANWATAYTTATPGFLSFPESGGAVTELKRKNTNGGADDSVYTITQIAGANIATIKVVEEYEEETAIFYR